MRYVMHLSYDGTSFNGFATQPHQNTIEDISNRVLSKIFDRDIKIIGASRTDAKVHALDQVIMFDCERLIPPHKVEMAYNNAVGDCIECFKCEITDEEFHVRYHVQSKTYLYKVITKRDPFMRTYATYHDRKLDLVQMQKACQQFIGTHDFTSFCTEKKTATNNIRTINYFHVNSDAEGIITFEINGNGFLYNMVRIIIGTVLMIGENKIASEQITEIMAKKNRIYAGVTAPPEGLYLKETIYQK